MVVSLGPQGRDAVLAQRVQEDGIADVDDLVGRAVHDERGRVDPLHKLHIRVDVHPDRPALHRRL